jgi:hypothetical protein
MIAAPSSSVMQVPALRARDRLDHGVGSGAVRAMAGHVLSSATGYGRTINNEQHAYHRPNSGRPSRAKTWADSATRLKYPPHALR